MRNFFTCIYGKHRVIGILFENQRMNPIKSISIPQPCHQSWNQMTPADNGRHCAHCCKTVIDFSSMTNDEIIGYLTIHNNVCGRFEDQQISALDRKIHLDNISGSNWWKRVAIVLGMIGPIALRGAAQIKPAIMNADDTTKTVQPRNFPL